MDVGTTQGEYTRVGKRRAESTEPPAQPTDAAAAAVPHTASPEATGL